MFYFIVLHFCNTFLNLFNIFSLFSGGIIISWTGSCFWILSSSNLVHADKAFDNMASAILFPKYSPALWATFLENLVLYLIIVSYIFSQMIENHILNIFSCSCFYRILRHFYLLISNVKLTWSFVSNGLPFWSVNVMIVSSNSVLWVFKNTKLLGSTFNK